MKPPRNEYDSRDLTTLREELRRLRPGANATPDRMGYYAGLNDIRITDMGAHSKRWVTRFGKALTKGHRERLLFTERRGE